MIKPIGSQQNPNYKRWKQVLEPRGIKKLSQTLISGRKIVPEILQSQPDLVQEILVTSEQMADEWNLTRFKNIFSLQNSHFKELDVFGTGAPLLVVSLPTIPQWDFSKKSEGLELLVATGDPSNLGALLRSAEAFGVSKVVLLKESAHAFHPKVTKTSSGSNLRINIESGPSIQNLESVSDLWALDMEGASILEVSAPKNLRLLIGEEGQGVPHYIPWENRISIPIAPQVESLNAVVAASIGVFLLKKPR